MKKYILILCSLLSLSSGFNLFSRHPINSLPKYQVFEHKRAFDQATMLNNDIKIQQEAAYFYEQLKGWLDKQTIDEVQKMHVLHTIQILNQVKTFVPAVINGLFVFLTTLEKPYSTNEKYEKIDEIFGVMKNKLVALITPPTPQAQPEKPTEPQAPLVNPFASLTFYTVQPLPDTVVQDAVNDLESVREVMIRPFETLQGKFTRPLKRVFTFQNAYKTLQLMKVLLPLAILSAHYLHKQDEMSPVKKKNEATKKVKFKDIKGIDNVIKQMKRILDFMQRPEKYKKLGGVIPRGYLLTGPPGVGKTLIGQALATETDATFFYHSGSEFVLPYVGQGAQLIDKVFQEARACKRAIIFIDEIDACTSTRESGGKGGDSTNATVNALLTQMDGFSSTANVIVLAATNLLDKIDPALRRPGRFSEIIEVKLPEKEARKDILQSYVNKLPSVAENIDMGTFADKTKDFNGAELSDLVNKAALNAIDRGADKVEQEDFNAALKKAKEVHKLRGSKPTGLAVQGLDQDVFQRLSEMRKSHERQPVAPSKAVKQGLFTPLELPSGSKEV